MNDKEILRKAIEKVIENDICYKDGYDEVELMFENPYELIFSHEFAKAFWGEKRPKKTLEGNLYIGAAGLEYWQEELGRMVLEENPLEYLEKFL